MSYFRSYSTNQSRLTLMWNLVTILFSVAAIGKTQAEDAATAAANTTASPPASSSPVLFFDLPSLSMILDVEKEEDSLIPFQEELKQSMDLHLEKFYKNKLLTSEVGIPVFVEVDLESQLLWKELMVSPKEIKGETTSGQAYSDIAFVKKYEVRGIFNCKIKLQIDPITTINGKEKAVYVSQTLINMFFLEAFENEHYWDMMHGFVTSPLLRDIISTRVTILDTGFEHPYDEDGNLLFESNNNDFLGLSIAYNDDSGMSPLVIVGSAFIVFFFLTLVAIWVYLIVRFWGETQRLRFWSPHKVGRSRSKSEGSHIESSATDSINSEGSNSIASGDQEQHAYYPAPTWAESITANLDTWASSITSIPLREVDQKRRRKRGAKVVKRPYFRPGHEHSSCLDNITEADNESWCSSVKSGRSSKSRAKKYSRSRSSSRSRSGSGSQTTRRPEDSFAGPVAAAQSFDSNSSPSVGATSAVIYEDDAENSEDDDAHAQSSPLLIQQRQLIKLIPSEDEDDTSWNEDNRPFEV